MQEKHKSLEDIDFVTELSMDELEAISGGVDNSLGTYKKPSIIGGSTQGFAPVTEPPPPDDNVDKTPRVISITPIITL